MLVRLRGSRAGYSAWQGSRWGWAPSTLAPTGPPDPRPSSRPTLSSPYNEERASIECHVLRPEELPPNPPLSGPSQPSKPGRLMPRCSALCLLGSESPLRGRKSSPKALQSVLKPPSRVYKLFHALQFTLMLITLLQGTAEMCHATRTVAGAEPQPCTPWQGLASCPCTLAHRSCFPDWYLPGLLGSAQLGWDGACTYTTKPRQWPPLLRVAMSPGFIAHPNAFLTLFLMFT